MPKLNGEVQAQVNPPESQTQPESSSTTNEAWLESVLPELRPIALRHGQELYIFCYQLGMAREAYLQMTQAIDRVSFVCRAAGAKNTAAELCPLMFKHTQVLASIAQALASDLLIARGIEEQSVKECTQDIERMLSLMSAPAGKIVTAN